MKKKGKKQTQEALEPKQRNVTLEIDYDKLAKAIVRAQSEVSQRQKKDPIQKCTVRFFKRYGLPRRFSRVRSVYHRRVAVLFS